MDATVSSILLRHSRCAARLTQRSAAHAAGAPQPSYARVESGRRDVTVNTLDTLLRPTGNRLIAVPIVGAPAAETAINVSDQLAVGNEPGAYREIIQLHDDLTAASRTAKIVLTFAPAPTTGDRRFDALIAAVVEHHLDHDAPPWTTNILPLDEVWHVDPYTKHDQVAAERTPPAFRRYRIVLDSTELDSR